MSKKVFSFIPYSFSPHIETELDIIYKHVQDGDDVTIFICGGELPTCYSNITHDLSECNSCTSRRRNGLNLTGLADKVQLRNFINLKPEDRSIVKRFEEVRISSIEELLAVKLNGCEIGRSIYNELVCQKAETEPDLESEADLIGKSIRSCLMVYLSFKNTFAAEKPDMFYTFNGRFVISHGAIAAAKEAGVNFAVHDRAGVLNRFSLVVNDSLHSIDYWKKQVQSIWQTSPQSEIEKNEIGCHWFEERLQNRQQEWTSLTADQTVDLPDGFDKTKTNIVIFNSSEWEFAGMDDYKLPFYESQSHGLLCIATDLQSRPDINVYLRVHPYLKGKDNSQTRFIVEKLAGKFSNFNVILAEDPIKTYQLMAHANLVLTFGSTTGMEAVYQSVPSIVLGPAFYEDLDSCLTVNSHNELIDVIVNEKYKLPSAELARRKTNCIKYGYFSQSFGEDFTAFEQTGIWEMKFKGQTVRFDHPSYEDGLKRELERRAELNQNSNPNPLVSLVRELKHLSDTLQQENVTLKSELEQLQLANQGLANHPVSHEPPRISIARVKGAVQRRLPKILQ